MIIWLASYPKSGNTWLRALLASYYFTKNGDFNLNLLDKINAFPSEKHFKNYPDKFTNPGDTSKYWIDEQKKINKNNKLIFLKTHMAVCKVNENRFTDEKNSLGGIYIVRDPRNLVTSLSHHYQISLDEAFSFMKDEKRAIYSKIGERYVGFQFLMSWKLNQKSWIENKIFPVLIIKYEELMKQTFVTFERVIKFINKITNENINFDKEKAKNCIENTSFKKLQDLEREKGFSEAMLKKGTTEKLKFFNLGKENNYKKLLKKNLINEMNIYFEKELEKFDYEK